MPPSSPARRSARRTSTGARSRSSPAGCRQTARSRLERLRGFGAALGTLVTCGCARLDFADGSHGVLVAATEPVGRAMPLVERLQRLVDGIDTPIAAFARDGLFVGASDGARSLLGFRDLTEAGLDEARSDALKQGRVETPIGIGHLVLQRVGTGADVGLVALIAPGATTQEPPQQSVTPARINRYRITSNRRYRAKRRRNSRWSMSSRKSRRKQSRAACVDTACIGARSDTRHTSSSERSRSPTKSKPLPNRPPPSRRRPIEASAPASRDPAKAPSWLDQPAPNTRRHPLRFMWQMDADGRFSLGSDEFTRLIGARTAAGFGRLWSDIAEAFGLDPQGRVLKAVATRDTWSGITLNWPVDGGDRLPVELSGLPMFDRARNFVGYRGFGVCRDLDGLARLAALRRYELFSDPRRRFRPASWRRIPPPTRRRQRATEIPVAESPIEDSSAEIYPLKICPPICWPKTCSSKMCPNSRRIQRCVVQPSRSIRADRFRDFTPNRFGNIRGTAQRTTQAIVRGRAEKRAAVPPDRRLRNHRR